MPLTDEEKRREYNKRYRQTHREKFNAYNRERYAKDPTAQKLATKNWTFRNRQRCNERIARWMRLNRPRLYNPNTPDGMARRQRENARKRGYTAVNKEQVLSHYGPNGKLKCSWTGCLVSDVDMLSLDHIDDNGAEHRRQMGGLGKAAHLYRRLIRDKFPTGFQTLCYNHQMKKELFRKRKHLFQI
jgi:hypothetical protein